MARHIFFIDPLEKLTLKKDSTLLLALCLQSKGVEVVLLFEEDFYCVVKLKVRDSPFVCMIFKAATTRTLSPSPNFLSQKKDE